MIATLEQAETMYMAAFASLFWPFIEGLAAFVVMLFIFSCVLDITNKF